MSKEREIIEILAALEHEQWIVWSQSIAETEKLSKERLKRWEKLWIPYDDLPEEIKEHDRIWAKSTLRLIEEYKNATKVGVIEWVLKLRVP